METHFLTQAHNLRFCSKKKSRTIAGSILSSRTLDCAQDGPSLTPFRRLGPENDVFFGFMVDTYFVVSRLLTCNRLLYESFLAETICCRSAASLNFVFELYFSGHGPWRWASFLTCTIIRGFAGNIEGERFQRRFHRRERSVALRFR